MRFGYVGIGLMGLPMTRRLLAEGHQVKVYDLDPHRMDEARASGAVPVGSPAAVCLETDAILLNLPTDYAVEQAVFGESGVAQAIKPPQRLVDFSTISVEHGQQFASGLLARTGCAWIDAPVSGGRPARQRGGSSDRDGGWKRA